METDTIPVLTGETVQETQPGEDSAILPGSEIIPQVDEYLLLKLAKNASWSQLEQILQLVQKGSPALRTEEKSSGWTPLFYVVAHSEVEIFHHFVECDADLRHTANDGRSICHIAAQFSNYDMAVCVANQFSKEELMLPTKSLALTPLHYACARLNNAIEIAKLFLRAGKEYRLIKDANGFIPLMVAAESENLALCRELLLAHSVEQVTASNSHSGDTVLHIACRTRQYEMIRLFCDQGALIDAQNIEGHTALHVAAWEGHEEIIRFFQQRNASANIFDKMDRSALHIAAERGHTSVVELLIDRFKASTSARTKDGSTLLHISSQCGHPDTALMFLKKGVPLLMPNKAGSTCLHVAASQGHVAVVKNLCQSGAQVDLPNKEGQTALHLAVENCKPMVVQTLLGFGSNVQLVSGESRETPLHIASKVMLNGGKVAEMLIKSGADVNAVDQEGETPVHVVARTGNFKVLRVLLNEDADPMIVSNSGETALHVAVRYCHYSAVEQLLKYTAEEFTMQETIQLVHTGNEEGETPLHLAAELSQDCAHFEGEEVMIMRLLLDHDADLYVSTDIVKDTPIHYCARGGNAEILSVILSYLNDVAARSLKRGSKNSTVANKILQNAQIRSINIRNKGGWSALMLAADNGHADVVEILLNQSVRVDLFDEAGKTALHLACSKGFTDITDQLLWHKAFVNSRTRLGVTPLHLAAQNGHSSLCQLLINSHGATVDVLSLTKKTPLHLAAQEGELDVCHVLLDLGADAFACDMDQQTPLHLAAEKDFSEIVKLFLSSKPELVSVSNSAGQTCAHIAASKGSLSVIKGLVKFHREGLVFDRDTISGCTTLHLAAAGGYSQIVNLLVDNGASPLEENDEGLTPLHLAAMYGHNNVLEVLKAAQVSLNYCSKLTGFSAIHVAAHFGQTDFVQELLQDVNADVASSPPAGMDTSLLEDEEGYNEYGFTPLHLASQSGHENLVRLLLNSPGVQPDRHTAIHGTTPLHLAAQSGHGNVIGLLLSKSEDLLFVLDNVQRSALHMAAANGNSDLVVLLVGQGAEVNWKDQNGWTPLHFAAKAGHLEVVKVLLENGSNALLETKDDNQAICYAAANSHLDVLIFLMRKAHNCHKLVKDPRFIFDIIQCSDSAEDPYKVLRYFILWSPAPLEIALKLSYSYHQQSVRRKDRAKEFFLASKFCQRMGVDLTSVTTSLVDGESIGLSQDLNGSSMLDIMIECEQKEVVAHASIQKYLSDVWMGHYTIAVWKVFLLLFAAFLPPVFFVMCLPIKQIKINKVPLVKMLLYITSHLYFIALLALTIAFKLVDRVDTVDIIVPTWNEWLIVVFICGLALSEVMHPGNMSGLGILRLLVLFLGCIGIIVHMLALTSDDEETQFDMIYIRNQVLGCAMLCCFVQLLDFLTFHHLFGPWAIIISDLMKDLFKFMILMGIFLLGFTLQVATIRQPAYPETFCTSIGRYPIKNIDTGQNNTYISGGRVVVEDITRMAFSLFGLVDYSDFTSDTVCIPLWAETWTWYVYGLYLVLALIVLINLLIAMMSDTYTRIEQQSDIEWKFGRALLIRAMSWKTPAAPPVNLFVAIVVFFYSLIKYKGKVCSIKEIMRAEESADDDDEILSTHGSQFDNIAVIGANNKDLELKLNHTNGTKKSLTTIKSGSVRIMGRKRHRSGRSGKQSRPGLEKCPVRVENLVNWDLVMNMYKDMKHMEDDELEDNRRQNDHKNYDLGGSFSATKVIDKAFEFTASN